ncbi:hypothetical protein TNCV_3220201 [Trichonephila clavipes]|nr:hypothetical protein TNCV_3220201 [Trichonephila clavipes]
MHSTDQSSRRPSHHTTRTSRTNCLCVFPYHRKEPGRMTSGIVESITCAANDTHPPTPPLGVVSCTTGSDYNRMGPGRLQRRI